MKRTDFSKAVTNYFMEYLPKTCGFSDNTAMSYRDTIKLLLNFFLTIKGIEAENIELKMLNQETVSEFLNWLEESKHVSVSTRNQRLAAIKAFVRYVQYQHPEYMLNCADIRNMRRKKHEKTIVSFITEDQLALLLQQPDTSTKAGLRDLAILTLLYDSGARVQELVDLSVTDLRLIKPTLVTLTGKGQKTRQVPLMKDTCKLMEKYIRLYHSKELDRFNELPLFYNRNKEPLTRYGIAYIIKKYANKVSPEFDSINLTPHVLRHTKAMHLLRAGVEMTYIRDFLGHVDISTTEQYARIDAELKRKVFEKTVPNFAPDVSMPWEEDEDLLQWLTSFGKRA